MHNELRGTLEVYYLEEKPESDEGPFLKEERDLINAISDRIGTFIEHKNAEDELRENEEKYRTLIENAGEAIIVVQDGVIKFANPKGEELYGRSQEELSSRHHTYFIHEEDRAMVGERHESRLKGEELHGTYSFRIIDKNGSIKWIELNVVLFSWEARPAALCFMTDITERKTLEQQLIQAQKMEAIGTLTSGIAHDFNNILTSIIGNAHMVLMDINEDDPLREEIEEIKEAGERAAALTRQLLTFSRKQIIQPEVMDLNDILSHIEKMLRRLVREDIELGIIPEPALWKVLMDPTQMEQVIMNLVVNAGDAMPRGGKLTIEAANVYLDESYFRDHSAEAKTGPYAMLAVSDTGIGMDDETQSHIFEPFFTTKEREQGTGLGLSTVYGIVKQSDGFVWAYSESGIGTTFKVYLPRVGGDAESAGEDPIVPVESSGSETILVVEDDKRLLKLALRILKQYGYNVLVAENGKEALRVVEECKEPIHLVLTDMVMPGMSGTEVAEQVKLLKPEIKVIYMSGYADNAAVPHGILPEEVNFIQKPFTPEGLARKVREVLDIED